MVPSFEVKPWKDEDPKLVVAGAKHVPNHAWALLEEEPPSPLSSLIPNSREPNISCRPPAFILR